MGKEFNGRYEIVYKDEKRGMRSADCHAMKIEDGIIYFYFTGLEPTTYKVEEVERFYISLHLNLPSTKNLDN